MEGRIVLVAFFLAGTSQTGMLEILGDPMRPAIADGVAIDKSLGRSEVEVDLALLREDREDTGGQ